MKHFSLLTLAALILVFSGCAKKSFLTHVKVTDATFNKIADIKDNGTLYVFEKLFENRLTGTVPKTDYTYFLEIESPLETNHWNYNSDGTCVLLKDGKQLAFFKIKDEKAFNKLIGIPEKP